MNNFEENNGENTVDKYTEMMPVVGTSECVRIAFKVVFSINIISAENEFVEVKQSLCQSSGF